MEDWPKHKKPCTDVAAAVMKRLAEEEETKIKADREAVTNPLAFFFCIVRVPRRVFRDVLGLRPAAHITAIAPAR